MTLSEFSDRILAAAQRAGLSARVEPKYASRAFRSTQEEVSSLRSGEAVGLQLGPFPVVAATLELEDLTKLEAQLKRLHGQMVIARSYMAPIDVINAHLLLCATTSGNGDWLSLVDVAQRDETVCRKIVWVPKSTELDKSFEGFVARTFMARPWDNEDAVRDAPLDHNRGVVHDALVEAGLTPALASQWEKLAEANVEDPDILVAKLVALMERQA